MIKGKETLCKHRVSLADLVLPLHFSLCLLQEPMFQEGMLMDTGLPSGGRRERGTHLALGT